MAEDEHLTALGRGISHWNEWRKRNPGLIKPDLSQADLTGFSFCQAVRDANTGDVEMIAANLRGVNFWAAKLSRARFTGQRANAHRQSLDRF